MRKKKKKNCLMLLSMLLAMGLSGCGRAKKLKAAHSKIYSFLIGYHS
jgi:hypothetical protein